MDTALLPTTRGEDGENVVMIATVNKLIYVDQQEAAVNDGME